MSDQEKKAAPARRVVVSADQSALLTTIDALGAHHVRQLEALAGRELELLKTVEDLRIGLELKQTRIAELETGRELARTEYSELQAALSAATAAKEETDRQLAHAYNAENKLLTVIRDQAERLTKIEAVIRDARQEGPAKTPLGEAVDAHLEELSEVIVDLRGALS